MSFLLVPTSVDRSAFAQNDSNQNVNPLPETTPYIYKKIGDVELSLYVFKPEGHEPSQNRPAAIFFFGGGWNGGSVSHFEQHCKYLASRGMVAIAADYRVKSRQKTTPFECVEDGKSAMRWLRAHADELGIDPDLIAAGGGSAGGHVAAAVATVPGLNSDSDDRSISCVPNALLLFNPVYDNGPDGYGHDRVKERYEEISPLHNIRTGMPPAIVFLGTNDALIPVDTAHKFQSQMREVGSRSELRLYKGQQHGFFNSASYRKNALPNYFYETVREMDEFLVSLGFLNGAPTIQPPLFRLSENDDATLDVFYGERAIARYMFAFDDSDEETRHDTYKPYLHVYDKQGKEFLTKGPGGKYTHHRGIFIGFNKIKLGEKQMDLWHMKQGVQVHMRFTQKKADASGASFTSEINWQENDGQPVLQELRTIRIHPPVHSAYTIIEVTSELKATSGDILLSGDPEHAGVQFRPANDIKTAQTEYVFHQDGTDPKTQTDLPWVAENFATQSGPHSVVLLNHPQNPTGTRFSAYRDYGRFGAFPAIELKAGESQVLRYQFVVSGGKMLPIDVIERAHQTFSEAAQ